jgi:hypothetical protein
VKTYAQVIEELAANVTAAVARGDLTEEEGRRMAIDAVLQAGAAPPVYAPNVDLRKSASQLFAESLMREGVDPSEAWKQAALTPPSEVTDKIKAEEARQVAEIQREEREAWRRSPEGLAARADALAAERAEFEKTYERARVLGEEMGLPVEGTDPELLIRTVGLDPENPPQDIRAATDAKGNRFFYDANDPTSLQGPGLRDESVITDLAQLGGGDRS